MTTRHRLSTLWNELGLLFLAGALALTSGCAGKNGWFGPKRPEPPQTVADFMALPRPK